MAHSISEKDGASTNASPAVETAFTATGSAGSHSAAVSDPRAKLRALFDVLGPSILRTPDGRTLMLTADALKTIPLHEGLSA